MSDEDTTEDTRPRWNGNRCERTGRPIIPNFERESGGLPATDESIAAHLEANGYEPEGGRW